MQLLPRLSHWTIDWVQGWAQCQREVLEAGHFSQVDGQAQVAIQQIDGLGPLHRGAVGEGGGEDPCLSGHVVLPKGLSQEPEVIVVTVTDHDHGGKAGGDDVGHDVDAVALTAGLL